MPDQEEKMRITAVTLGAAIAFGIAATTASAAPTIHPGTSDQASNIIEVAGGCGWGSHRNRRGYCVPRRYGYSRAYRYRRSYWSGYYGDGHEPWNRPSPSDHVANRLNRQELRGGWPY
jgi:hypothetical protein